MQIVSIPANQAAAVASLRDRARADPSCNMYEAPPLLEEFTTSAESWIAALAVRSQQSLLSGIATPPGSPVNSLRQNVFAYVGDANVCKTGRVLSSLVSAVTAKQAIGKIPPPGVLVRNSDAPMSVTLVYSIKDRADKMEKRLLALFRYLSILQRKIILDRAPFALSLRPLKVYQDLLSEEVTADMEISLSMRAWAGPTPGILPSKLAAEAAMSTLLAGGANSWHFFDSMTTTSVSLTSVESVDPGGRKPLPGFLPVDRYSTFQKFISDVSDMGVLESEMAKKADEFLETFADPNTAIFYCDYLAQVITTLQSRVSYPLEIHSRFL